MNTPRVYAGIDNDDYGGMTPTGTVIRDARVFGLISPEETCEGWTAGQLQKLYEEVHNSWGPYGHLASKLPPELAERHRRIHDQAIARARSLGWAPELGDND